MKYIKYYRMWLPDIVEPEGGTWCYMGADENGYMYQLNFNYNDEDELDTYDTYIEWGYKIEEL
jgi:hypothetical protein